jgi:hypothetical protein
LITGGYFVFHGYPDVIYMYACMYVCMRVFHKVLKHEGEDLNVPFLIIQTDQKKRRDETPPH